MKRIFCITLIVICWLSAIGRSSSADVLFESGALGPTGIPWSDLENGTVPGTNVSQFVFPGVRFHLDQPAMTTQVGGHFASPSSGTFFGAIVKLNDANDFPDSDNLSTPDVLGTTVIAFPSPSAEVFGNLSLSLDPGWYALAFGSGLFGTSAIGGAPQNNSDIGNPVYISFQTGTGWFNLSDLSDVLEFNDYRFVVRGYVVPEPSALVLSILGTLIALITRRRK